MNDELMELPDGWELSKLEDVAEIIMGQSPPGDSYNQDEIGVPLINGPTEFGPEAFSKTIRSKFTTSPTKYCKKDDLILCVRGSTTGRMNIAGFDACIGRGVAAVRSLAYQSYLNIFVHSSREKIYRLGTGSTFPNVSAETLNKIAFPLPPLNEQKRIVAQIEALRERSQKAKAALEAIPELCDRFRQSVLAAAFRGDLTADWRKENLDVEPASVLLERIKAERRQKWEELELAKIKEKGIQAEDNKWKSKYTAPEPIDSDQLPELPQGWQWSSVEEIVINYDHLRVPIKAEDRKLRQGPYPYYGAFGIIDQINEYIFDGEYLLLAEDGKNLLYRNKPIALIASGKFWVNNHAHVMQTLGEIHLSYLEAYFNSIDLTFHLTGIDQVKLTRGALDKIPVPLAPLQEQLAMISQIASCLSTEKKLFTFSMDGLAKLDYLNQSILAKAFRGELVDQDPNDEPSAVLLERIRSEREAQQPAKQKQRKGSKRSKSTESDQINLSLE